MLAAGPEILDHDLNDLPGASLGKPSKAAHDGKLAVLEGFPKRLELGAKYPSKSPLRPLCTSCTPFLELTADGLPDLQSRQVASWEGQFAAKSHDLTCPLPALKAVVAVFFNSREAAPLAHRGVRSRPALQGAGRPGWFDSLVFGHQAVWVPRRRLGTSGGADGLRIQALRSAWGTSGGEDWLRIQEISLRTALPRMPPSGPAGRKLC